MTSWSKLPAAHLVAAAKNIAAGAWVTTPERESQPLREATSERERAYAEDDVEEFVVLRAREEILRERLEEALDWREALHPRDRLGEFIQTLGSTPYLKAEHARLAPAESKIPRTTFAEAKALHSDSRFSGLFRFYERRAEALAAVHEVELLGAERNVGIYKGSYEPSYAIRARGKQENIDAFNEALGREFHQEAVVGFTPDESGEDREIGIVPEGDPDVFAAKVSQIFREVYGTNEAGVSYDRGQWRIFVLGPSADDTPEAFAETIRLRDLFATRVLTELGAKGEITKGRGTYIETGGHDG